MNQYYKIKVKPSESDQLTTHFLFVALFQTLLKKDVITKAEVSDIFDNILETLNTNKTDDSTEAVNGSIESIDLIRERLFT